MALVDARQALQQVLQQDNRYVQLFQANQTNVAQVYASQNLQLTQMNVDASQNLLNIIIKSALRESRFRQIGRAPRFFDFINSVKLQDMDLQIMNGFKMSAF